MGTDIQFFGYFLGRKPVRQQAEDLEFPVGQVRLFRPVGRRKCECLASESVQVADIDVRFTVDQANGLFRQAACN